jgi:hypothetical protein
MLSHSANEAPGCGESESESIGCLERAPGCPAAANRRLLLAVGGHAEAQSYHVGVSPASLPARSRRRVLFSIHVHSAPRRRDARERRERQYSLRLYVEGCVCMGRHVCACVVDECCCGDGCCCGDACFSFST